MTMFIQKSLNILFNSKLMIGVRLSFRYNLQTGNKGKF